MIHCKKRCLFCSEVEIKKDISATFQYLPEYLEIINEDPRGKGWIGVIELDSPSKVNCFLYAAEHGKYPAEESK